MELTAEIYIFMGLLASVITLIGAPIILELYSKWRFKRILVLAENFEHLINKKGGQEQLSNAVDAFVHIGGLASNANAIMADEELFDGLLSTLANRIMKSLKMSMMGTASGDVKKYARAERLVNEALVEGIKKMNPYVEIILKVTGLDQEIQEDPELFGLILQVITKNEGLMGMLQNLGGVEALTGTSQQDQDLIRTEIRKGGIDF